MTAPRRRVLLGITAYNGREFFERTLESAKQIDTTSFDLEIAVFDDASPEPGFAEWLAERCAAHGIFYYRTPRNLGIVRNVNLVLLYARDQGHDFAIISNSDVVYPANLLDGLVAVADSDETIGSVTAWSSNVSVYSLPNSRPDELLTEQSVVNEVSTALNAHFGTAAVDIPAGISFCLLVPRRVLLEVGLMDPVFGRGYCEETDWTLRSKACGYRIALAPGVFTFHAGQGSTLAAGLLGHGETTVPANEAIIGMRYPLFRGQVEAFLNSSTLDELHLWGASAIIVAAARERGYRVDVGSLPREGAFDDQVRVTLNAHGTGAPVARYRGFEVPVIGGQGLAAVVSFFAGQEPAEVLLHESGQTRDLLLRSRGGVRVVDHVAYPERV
ncbi:glycosyltransferase family 2 protein [Modestobacter versicolor]|uniref:glycosyltransferase family 2 protein n=1 Tax=Modestobacter versicolor TaxID=429133 RepID=UPI0034DDF086